MFTTNQEATEVGFASARIMAGLAYEGTAYRGFAAQNSFRTVAGDFQDAFEKITSFKPSIVCAGRTDAGVHALGQVIHWDIPSEIVERNAHLAVRNSDKDSGTFLLLNKWFRSLNKMLAPECTLFELDFAPPDFHARYSAIYRRYRYDINLSRYQDPRVRGICWHMEEALDVSEMEKALETLVGEHNFAAFCRRPPGAESGLPIIRRVDSASFAVCEVYGYNMLRLEIQANAFCHQMIRSLVGLLAAIGLGRLRRDVLNEKISSGDRDGMPSLAPPGGLCLTEVGYPDALGGPRSLLRMI